MRVHLQARGLAQGTALGEVQKKISLLWDHLYYRVKIRLEVDKINYYQLLGICEIENNLCVRFHNSPWDFEQNQ